MKKYVRKGFEDREPQSKAQHVLAWMQMNLFDNIFDAGDEFDEGVAYGTIIEVPAVTADYKCTNGHDRCYGGTSEGPECPYCEKVTKVKADDRESGQVYQGCICPPTSEQTCMNAQCPRRNYYTPYQYIPGIPNQPSDHYYPSYPPICPSIPPTIHKNPYPTVCRDNAST